MIGMFDLVLYVLAVISIIAVFVVIFFFLLVNSMTAHTFHAEMPSKKDIEKSVGKRD
jgi:hypothetical protein